MPHVVSVGVVNGVTHIRHEVVPLYPIGRGGEVWRCTHKAVCGHSRRLVIKGGCGGLAPASSESSCLSSEVSCLSSAAS